MAARLTHSGITPLSERISIFEQKKQTSTTMTTSTSATSSPMASLVTPGKMQQHQQVTSVTKKSVTTSRNFSQIMSQFGGNESGRSSSPATPSPPSSLRSSSQSLNLSNSQLFTPTPAARTTVSGSTTKTPLAPVDVNAAQTPRTTLTPLKPVSTRATFTPSVPKSASPTVAPSSNSSFSYSFSVKQDLSVADESVTNGGTGSKPGRDETDKVNGNFSSASIDNLNERNKKLDLRRKSSDKLVAVEKPEVEPAAVIVELDNVRSTKNLNLKNQLGSGSTNGQVRGSYWTSQALQNDNAQKISEVIHRPTSWVCCLPR